MRTDRHGTVLRGARVAPRLPDQHAARESFTYRRTGGAGTARMRVFSGTGVLSCETFPHEERTFTCDLPEGPGTVILEAGTADATYHLIHGDPPAPAG